jgi:serine/threonine protein kinase
MSRKTRQLFEPGSTIASYTIIRLLGQGGYGDIYCVRQGSSSGLFAMKIEAFSAAKRGLDAELTFMEELQDSPLFPRLIESGTTETHRFVVEELLGPSVSTARRQLPGKCYSLLTALRVAVFMVECLRDFHHHGFVHRDVKPGNFLLRNGGRNPLVLIDFGLSKRFIDPQTAKPFPERPKAGFRGTSKYASLNVHSSRDQGPRDDMISWLYSVVELVDGKLPWGQERDTEDIQRRKAATADKILFKHLPHEFIEISYYLGTLGYLTKVNYDYIICLLREALRKSRKQIDAPFDWEALDQEHISEISAIQLPKAIDYLESMPHIEIPPEEEEDEDNRCAFCGVG